MPSIIEVARLAGVSTATVSRVTAGSGRHVRPDTRERVLRAADELCYAPNAAARFLRTQQSGKLLVMVSSVSDAKLARTVQAIAEAALQNGYGLLLGITYGEARRERLYTSMLERKEADGVVCLGGQLPSAIQELVRRPAPTPRAAVAISEHGHLKGISSVVIDSSRVAQDAIRYLCSAGHRQIVMITGPADDPSTGRQMDGVRAGKTAHSMSEVTVVSCDGSVAEGLAAADDILDGPKRPSAIFCVTDAIGAGAIQAARRRALRVPGDLSVLALDELGLGPHLDPPLSTMTPPFQDIGRGCMKLVLQAVRKQLTAETSMNLRYELIERATTGPRTCRLDSGLSSL